MKKIDLHAVVRAAFDAARPAAETKGVELVCELSPDSAEFCGDPDRLQQIIGNLLGNAVKFTPRAGRVELRLAREQSRVVISVRDTGVGISPAFLPHVFDRFRQADSSITRTQGGLGLGLAIVRHLVEVHGGTVEAGSEGEGKGALFVVQLPLRAVAPEAEEGTDEHLREMPAAAEPDALRGLDVLVLDDEPDARELVTAVLVKSGARVRTAGSVEEAIALLREHRPDVVLSDIGLPTEDGYAFIRRVREIDGTVPAAALTAYAGIDDRRRALEAGFQAHVSKPIEPGKLTLLVASLAGRRSHPELGSQQIQSHAVAG
jgi:CheY-like chemotaxis protein/anti-sigma regulatory factor (Ser/Thr protein kinase)